MNIKPQIFLSYTREDIDLVRKLYDRLVNAGFRPWMDVNDILPGEMWQKSIQNAIQNSDFFLACLSQNSVSKRGYLQREIMSALNIMQEKLESDIYLIPVKLEDCQVPSTLDHYQWVNLHQKDGWDSLLRAITAGMRRRGVRTKKIKSLYDIENIKSLLINCLSIEDLRRLSYELPSFRAVFEQLSRESNKSIIANLMLDYAIRESAIEPLLETIKEHYPLDYERYKPYFSDSYKDIYQDSIELSHRLLNNPYVVGNPIQPENMNVFLGRFDIANAIISEIKKDTQKPSLLLYGRRRMGKTSALLNISNLIKDPAFVQVYISGQSVKYHSNVNFSFHLVNQICHTLQQEGIDIDDFEQQGFLLKKQYINNPILKMAEFFDAYHKFIERRGLYCLISIDEYEEIDRHIDDSRSYEHTKNITRELLLELRETLQHKPRIMFLFAGTHYMRDLSNLNWSEIFINVKTLHISFLKRNDGYNLLTKPVPRIQYENQEIINEILDLTGCQPFLLQATASEIITLLNLRSDNLVTQEILDSAIQEVLTKHNTYFDYLWDTECSSSLHQELMKIVSGIDGGIDESKLTNYEDALRDLVRREVLSVTHGKVELTMPILKKWMKKNKFLL